jgi:hypothetical protein
MTKLMVDFRISAKAPNPLNKTVTKQETETTTLNAELIYSILQGVILAGKS